MQVGQPAGGSQGAHAHAYLTVRLPGPGPALAADEMEGGPAPDAARALAVTFVQKPQDGSADAALDVALMPSYVYYSGAGLAPRESLLEGERRHFPLGCLLHTAAQPQPALLV